MIKNGSKPGMTLKIKVENNITERSSSFINQVLNGLGQKMIQQNAVTGFLFLIGIFYGSLLMGLAALLATISGTLTAKILKYDKTEIDKGLYGFSAALTGVAVILFLKPVFFSWMFILIGSMLATIIQQFFIRRKIPVFTLPFVLVTWAILLLARHFFPHLLPVETSIPVALGSDNFTFAIKGFGQVIFQSNVVSGTLFFIAVFISSPIAALYGLAAAVLSAILSLYFSVSVEDIGMGLFSYNAVLCAIVFAGPQRKDSIWVLISVVLSVVISLIMSQYHLTQLTFPFVVASCITLVLKNKINLVA